MSSWEIWFRTQHVDEVRKSLGLLESQIRNETSKIQKVTGNHYPEIMALSERLESLNFLGKSLESRITKFVNLHSRNDVNYQIFGTDNETLVLTSLDKKLNGRICQLVGLGIVQQNFALAARALYLREALGLIETPESRILKTRLSKLLQKYIQTENHVCQAVFHACIIHMKLSPAQFLSAVLEFRKSHIETILLKSGSIIEFLKAVDSSIFVYNQVISDWGNARLSQRRILDEPALAGILAPFDLSTRTKDLSDIKVFPKQCYAQGDRPLIEDFTQQICHKLGSSLPNFMANYTNIGSLVDLMRETFSQVEASLSSLEKGLNPIIHALEPFFAHRLLELIVQVQAFEPSNLEDWELRVIAASSGLSQLAKLAAFSKQYAPELSAKITQLLENATTELKRGTSRAYKEHFDALRLNETRRPLSLETAARLLAKLTSLNETYARLGGEMEQIPDAIYEDIAEGLWRISEKRKQGQQKEMEEAKANDPNAAVFSIWGDGKMASAFSIQLLMDEFLGRFPLSSRGIALMRRKLASYLASTDGEASSDNSYFQMENSRSYLLLRPLAAQNKK